MKWNELTAAADRERYENFISERWAQLSQLELDWSTDAIKYLLLVNSGAAATMLTFIGAVEGVRNLVWSWGILFMFTLGIIFVGGIHICRVRRIEYLYKNWRNETRKFYASELDFEKLLEDDNARAYSFNWAYVWGYGAFCLFVAGVFIGAANLSSLAKGDSNGSRQQQTQQTIIPTPSSAASKPRTINSGKMERRDQGPNSDSGISSSPSPTSSGEKEIKPANRKDPS